MKKIIALLLTLFVAFSIAGCGKKDAPTTKNSDTASDSAATENDGKTANSESDKAESADGKNDGKNDAASTNDGSTSKTVTVPDGEEFGDLMEGYEKAKADGDKDAEREYLDKLQVIFDQMEDQNQ